MTPARSTEKIKNVRQRGWPPLPWASSSSSPPHILTVPALAQALCILSPHAPGYPWLACPPPGPGASQVLTSPQLSCTLTKPISSLPFILLSPKILCFLSLHHFPRRENSFPGDFCSSVVQLICTVTCRFSRLYHEKCLAHSKCSAAG